MLLKSNSLMSSTSGVPGAGRLFSHPRRDSRPVCRKLSSIGAQCQWWSERAKMRTDVEYRKRSRESGMCPVYTTGYPPPPYIYFRNLAGNFPGNPTKQRIKPESNRNQQFPRSCLAGAGLRRKRRVTIIIAGLLCSGCRCCKASFTSVAGCRKSPRLSAHGDAGEGENSQAWDRLSEAAGRLEAAP